MTERFLNMLLVSGSGRNVGKTSFIRKVIAQNKAQNLAAIKITPHFHEPTPGLLPVEICEQYRVYEETDASSAKDSSLFLQSGAKRVFYIQTSDAHLGQAFRSAAGLLRPDQPIIAESAALRRFVHPGLYLFIQRLNDPMKPSALEMQQLADITLYSDGNTFSINPESFVFHHIWKTR